MKMALGLLIAAQLIATPAEVNVNVYAEPENAIAYGAEVKEPNRQEEFMWFYRDYNGVEQKRLWSITYGYWVTDWINC